MAALHVVRTKVCNITNKKIGKFFYINGTCVEKIHKRLLPIITW